MLAQNEDGLLTQHHDVVVLQVDVEVETDLPGLLADVGHP